MANFMFPLEKEKAELGAMLQRYGYVSGGGGEWYVRTLRMLEPGNRIWVSVPGKGYVGVGRVVTPAMRFDEFQVQQNGSLVPITTVGLQAPKALQKEQAEHFRRG